MSSEKSSSDRVKVFSLVNVFNHSDILRILASPHIDHVKDGILCGGHDNHTRHKLIKGGFYSSVDGKVHVDYYMPEKGRGRLVGEGYGFHCMSRLARNYLCREAGLVDLDLKAANFNTWLWLGKQHKSGKIFRALERYVRDPKSIRRELAESLGISEDKAKAKINKFVNLDELAEAGKRCSLYVMNGNSKVLCFSRELKAYENLTFSQESFLAELCENIAEIRSITAGECKYWDNSIKEGWMSIDFEKADGDEKSDRISKFCNLTFDLERCLIHDLMNKASMVETIVSYNQDGFIMMNSASVNDTLMRLNAFLTASGFCHELAIKPFEVDEELLAPRGSRPTLKELIPLTENIYVKSVKQGIVFHLNDYLIKMSYLVDNVYYSTASKKWMSFTSSDELTQCDTLRIKEAFASRTRVLGKLGTKEVMLDFFKYLQEEDEASIPFIYFSEKIHDSRLKQGITIDTRGASVLNTWRPFLAERYDRIFGGAEDHICLQKYQDILSAICGDNKDHYDFVLNCLATRIQFPEKRMNHMVIFYSKDKGTGKSVFWSAMIDNIFGQNMHAVAITDVEKDLFGTYTNKIDRRKLIYIDEFKKDLFSVYVDRLKSMITFTTNRSRHMYADPDSVDNNPWIIMTTNELDIALEQGDRRVCLIEGSSRLKNSKKPEWFEDFYNRSTAPLGARTIFEFLKRHAIPSDFCPQDFPKTKLRQSLMPKTDDPILEFLCSARDYLTKEPKSTRELFNYYRAWAGDNEITTGPKSEIIFGKELSRLDGQYIEKTVRRGCRMNKLMPRLWEREASFGAWSQGGGDDSEGIQHVDPEIPTTPVVEEAAKPIIIDRLQKVVTSEIDAPSVSGKDVFVCKASIPEEIPYIKTSFSREKTIDTRLRKYDDKLSPCKILGHEAPLSNIMIETTAAIPTPTTLNFTFKPPSQPVVAPIAPLVPQTHAFSPSVTALPPGVSPIAPANTDLASLFASNLRKIESEFKPPAGFNPKTFGIDSKSTSNVITGGYHNPFTH